MKNKTFSGGMRGNVSFKKVCNENKVLREALTKAATELGAEYEFWNLYVDKTSLENPQYQRLIHLEKTRDELYKIVENLDV